MSADSDLARYRDQAVRLRSDIAKASTSVAAKRKKAADSASAATRTSSAQTRKTKLRDAERATDEANTAEQKRATLETKLADVEKKAAEADVKAVKERAATQQKALDAIRRQSSRAATQFIPPSSAPVRATTLAAEPQTDVFLSHASEDKDDVARPLRDALESRGLSVWFDEIKIKLGQSIRVEIEKGILNAKFGVVILSPHFFTKQWTQAELDALFSRKMATGESALLPIWHRVSKDDVMRESPLLAGLLALNTSLHTIEEIADQIRDVVRAEPDGYVDLTGRT